MEGEKLVVRCVFSAQVKEDNVKQQDGNIFCDAPKPGGSLTNR